VLPATPVHDWPQNQPQPESVAVHVCEHECCVQVNEFGVPYWFARHHAKVYGMAEAGAPPMSVPHLDTRWIDGRQELLFGPYAGFTTKFAGELTREVRACAHAPGRT
jgi:malate:quinone oxidoreductase Mqo